MALAYARGTEARIDLDAIRANVRTFVEAAGSSTAVMAVVKADGYGHGALPVGRAAIDAGAAWLGVATAEEGAELRESGIAAPILVLGSSTDTEVRLAVEHHLDLTVFEPGVLNACRHWAARLERAPRVHLKVDTGMARVGIQPEELPWWADELSLPGLVWQGLMSHLAAADGDPEYTRSQMARFLDVVEQLRITRGTLPPTLHLANSAAALRFPGTRFNLVRVGIGIYGLPPWPGAPQTLVPALSWTSRVTLVKRIRAGQPVGYGMTFTAPHDARIATVAVGYADGYPRVLSNRSAVLIGGWRCPVVGRISMDQLTVLVPDDIPVQVGDAVILIGSQGSARIGAEELAELADTISYEIVAGISPRVPRLYAD